MQVYRLFLAALSIGLIAAIPIPSVSQTTDFTVIGGEYFFTNDPGKGNAEPFEVRLDRSADFNIDVAHLSIGFHTVYFRFVNESGKWGRLDSKTVYIPVNPSQFAEDQIIQGEYFFDEDPGEGNGIALPLGMESIVRISDLSISVDGLRAGPHRLGVRFMNQRNLWGGVKYSWFSIPNTPSHRDEEQIAAAEYFFNDDPGEGLGVPLPLNKLAGFTPSPDSIYSLGVGIHALSVRLQNRDGIWGPVKTKSIALSEDVFRDIQIPPPTNTPVPTNTPEPTATPTVTPKPTRTPSSIFTFGGDSISAMSGQSVLVPFMVKNLPSTTSFTFDVAFDSSVLMWDNQIVKENALISQWGLVDGNIIEDSLIRISGIAINAEPVQNDGILLYIPFSVVDNTNGLESTQIVPQELKDGLHGAKISPIEITLRLGKKGDVNEDGEITAADAQMAFEIVLHRITPTDKQLWSADVTEDGEVTASDAQKIFEVVLGKTVLKLLSNFRQGDSLKQTTGNYLKINSISGSLDSTLTVPLMISSESAITSFTLDVTYNPAWMTFVSIDKTNSMAKDFLLFDANEVESGVVRIAGAAITSPSVSGEGVLVDLNFTVNQGSSGSSDLAILALKDDIADFETVGGSVSIQTAVMDWMIR